jgi:hypothetical protein
MIDCQGHRFRGGADILSGMCASEPVRHRGQRFKFWRGHSFDPLLPQLLQGEFLLFPFAGFRPEFALGVGIGDASLLDFLPVG